MPHAAWSLLPANAQHQRQRLPLALEDIASLMEQVGRAGSDAVAQRILHLLGQHVALAQCAIFSFQGMGQPKLVGLGDRARTLALPFISQSYSQRFYRLDRSQQVMQAEHQRLARNPQARPRIWLHRQRPEDVAHPEYRAICYTLPKVVERLSLLMLQDNGRWLSLNLYRGVEHGAFAAADIACLEAFVPFLMQVMRLHYAGQALEEDLLGWVIARLQRRFPQLTQRDADVIASLAEGMDSPTLAQRLGITESSARTYIKRVCAKLGVQGQRELFALLLEPAAQD